MPDSLIYGRHPVLEALEAGEAVSEIFLDAGAREHALLAKIQRQARAAGIPVKRVPGPALDRLAAGAGRAAPRHQGVVARLAEFRYADLNEILARGLRRGEPAFILALDALQDVHNLGNLLRSAEAAGVDGVLLATRHGAGISAAVRKASAGAVAHLAVARLELPPALDALAARGIRVVGLDEAAGDAPGAVDLAGPLALVVGAEERGISEAVRRRCAGFLRLPMRGRVASLNAGVAGSIALYEALRQRSAPVADRGEGGANQI